jgi:tetrahydromethanopterin S-methyltransferase subunit F
MKPLFVPLMTEHYEAVKAGTKRIEYRLYGKRWNDRTCLVGRRITLSKGYGKGNRINGFIVGFNAVYAADSSCPYDVLESCYPNIGWYTYIAEIKFRRIEE